MSIIYRFIALLHFNSDLILFLCTISIMAHADVPSICDATATIYYFICTPYVLYYIVWILGLGKNCIATGNANGIRYNGLAVKLEIDDALQLNSFNIEFNSALKTK